MSRTSKIVIATIGIAVMILPVVAAAGRLSDGEKAHLIFMRSEEKLARDVYLTFAGIYPEMPVFNSIATQAEQTHTDTMRDTLLRFNVSDPEPNADAMDLGNFENPYFSEYFTGKFELLTEVLAFDLLSALHVGALIEELDMKDIKYCNEVIYDVFGFPKPPEYPVYCGLTVTDVRALENTLGNLLAGSENHLCAFVSQIGPMIQPNECYGAQYLTPQEVWDIIDATCPEFTDYVCPVPEL